MNRRALILARIDLIQAELTSLAALLFRGTAPESGTPDGGHRAADALAPVEPTVTVAEPTPSRVAIRAAPKHAPRLGQSAPAPAAAPPRVTGPSRRGRKPGSVAKWSYLAGASYRLVGENPFKSGNNKVLFDHLHALYAQAAFTREDLGRAITALRGDDAFRSGMDDHASAVAFVNLSGAKGRIAMASEVPVAKGRAPRRRRSKIETSAPTPRKSASL